MSRAIQTLSLRFRTHDLVNALAAECTAEEAVSLYGANN
eukprot:CAMPEP_0179018818 /NCGR_PEP_ID=MMETSP0796-20121207/4551_1 /TAXON_ID=73915 /ORGANISM="Pyrodinium bahamense, Strain pbaha01" /LENGTH=38 /DNA_ID= /DNA_START= /DNA_END= /DNA_ORIENTATION=